MKPYGDMAELGRAVNEMAADLEKHQENQRYMLMDIAHDLRTPSVYKKLPLRLLKTAFMSLTKLESINLSNKTIN